MNILFDGFNGELSEIVGNLLVKMPVDSYIVVQDAAAQSYVKPGGRVLGYEDCKHGTYGHVDWNTVRPIERDLIISMAYCEVITLKMLERLAPAGIDVGTYEIRKRLYYRHLRYWNHLILEDKIQACIMNTIPHVMYDFVIYHLCRHYNIPVLLFYRMPTLPGKNISKYLLHEIEKPGIEFRQRYEELKSRLTPDEHNHVVLAPSMQAYFDEHQPNKKAVAFTGVIRKTAPWSPAGLLKKVRYYGKVLLSGDTGMMRNLISWHWKASRVKAIYRELARTPDLSKKYIYVALHYQPECTTSPMAGPFVHQILMIQLLAHVLPKDVLLYVKEHPRENLVIDLSFYEDMHALPNVRLMPRNFDSQKLIDSSLAVATGTGTAGWEALLRGKPVIMFGHYFYQYAPGVFHVGSIEECRAAVDEIVAGKAAPDINDLRLFLKAAEDFVIDGWADFRYEKLATISRQQNLDKTSEALLRELRRHTGS
ncbi:MAG: hypothetical protein V1913_03360 [Fibrobacterota bacterium]